MIAELNWAPLLPWQAVAAAAVIAVILLGYLAARRGRGVALRAFALAVLVLGLLNPSLTRERNEPLPDMAVIVIDRSASQSVGERREQGEAALKALRAKLSRFDNLEVREVSTRSDGEDTRLFDTLTRALADVPRHRLAGAVLITDGQAHDIPAEPSAAPGVPLHVLLTGRRGEIDRRLVVGQAPGYGIVGKEITITYKIEDQPLPASSTPLSKKVRVRLRRDGVEAGEAMVPVGDDGQFTFTLEHAGPTLMELEADPVEGELSTLNNRALVSINGVRDRLQVLLISGQPHGGERVWRNLLKSDPSVDLVHFTILRPPDKDIYTPLKELSLIAFPVQELFAEKLHDFDLIVFDRYMMRDVLPDTYLKNITKYLRKGGAILLAVGPEFAGPRSLFRTPMGAIMPAVPNGVVIEKGFTPILTEDGRRHPVTAVLPGNNPWGRWFRQVEADVRHGTVLMEGPGGRPLLILDRVGKGRVALLLSDHIWLWARGFENGGPHAELIRRLAHWLMKEPDLEEEALLARIDGRALTIERRSLRSDISEVTLTTPSGKERLIPLEAGKATVPVTETGLYRIDDGTHQVVTAAGDLNPLEMSDLRATAERLAPTVAATGGGISWITDGVPDIRRTRPGRDTSGRGWIGLRRNQAFTVTGATQVPLLPGPVLLVLVLGALMAGWWREGR